jgi:hypothetical protein
MMSHAPRRDRVRQLSMPATKPTPAKSYKLLLEILGVIATILAIAGFFLSNIPKLSIDLSGSFRPTDPMGTVFSLSNDGVLAIHDVTAICGLDNIGNARIGIKNLTITLPESYAPDFRPVTR